MDIEYSELKNVVKHMDLPDDVKLILETLGNSFGFNRYNLYHAGKLFDQVHPAIQDTVVKGMVSFLIGYALRDNAHQDGRNKDATLLCRNLARAIDEGKLEPYPMGMFVPYSERTKP